MDVTRRIREARNLTPAETQLAGMVLAMGDRLQTLSIKELAAATSCSVPTIHRFCKKLGLEGYKELKVELARSAGARATGEVDINFPFAAGDDAAAIAPRMELVYETTLRETREVLDPAALDHAASLLDAADCIDVYTQSHNLYPARMFCERLISAGMAATCHDGIEGQVRTALASGPGHVAVCISYSGLAPNIGTLLPILSAQKTPVVMVTSPQGARRHPGFDAYLLVSDRENLQDRITQFASHIAVQYVLDTLYSCVFALNYEKRAAFLKRSLPYTRLPGI